MTIEILYRKLSKICFIILLLFIGITIAASNTLPNFKSVTSFSTQCYWTDALFIYIKCGSDVPYRSFIGVILNYSYYFSIMLLMPLLILFFSPISWTPIISFYFLAFSYPVAKIRRKLWGEPKQEKTYLFFKIIKWLLITVSVISILVTTMDWFYKKYRNNVYFFAKTGVGINIFPETKYDYRRAAQTAIRREEITVFKKIYKKVHPKNHFLLEDAIYSTNIEILEFLLDDGIVLSNFLKTVVVGNIDRGGRCEDNPKYLDVVDFMMKRGEIFEEKSIIYTARSLCYPAMKILFEARGNINYENKNIYKTLVGKINSKKISPSDSLYNKPLKEQLAYRQKMIGLVLVYRDKLENYNNNSE